MRWPHPHKLCDKKGQLDPVAWNSLRRQVSLQLAVILPPGLPRAGILGGATMPGQTRKFLMCASVQGPSEQQRKTIQQNKTQLGPNNRKAAMGQGTHGCHNSLDLSPGTSFISLLTKSPTNKSYVFKSSYPPNPSTPSPPAPRPSIS